MRYQSKLIVIGTTAAIAFSPGTLEGIVNPKYEAMGFSRPADHKVLIYGAYTNSAVNLLNRARQYLSDEAYTKAILQLDQIETMRNLERTQNNVNYIALIRSIGNLFIEMGEMPQIDSSLKRESFAHAGKYLIESKNRYYAFIENNPEERSNAGLELNLVDVNIALIRTYSGLGDNIAKLRCALEIVKLDPSKEFVRLFVKSAADAEEAELEKIFDIIRSSLDGQLSFQIIDDIGRLRKAQRSWQIQNTQSP